MITDRPRETLLDDVPFGEAEGLSDDLILGNPEMLTAQGIPCTANVEGKLQVS